MSSANLSFDPSNLLHAGGGGDAQDVIDAARAAALPVKFDDLDVPFAFVVPVDAKLELPDLSAWRERPSRKTGNKSLSDLDSFILYAKRHASPDTTVWMHRNNGSVVAVFDDHSGHDKDMEWQLAGWGQHTAKLQLEHSPEWLYWTAKDGVLMNQVDFVEHIEGGLMEIIEPDAADMLEVAQNFHATTGATFRSSVRLQSGEQQLQYDEEVQATAGIAGAITVPTRFLLALSPWEGEEARSVGARLRFRVSSGKLSLGYYLDRPDRVIRESLENVLKQLKDAFENVYVGTPT